MLVALPKGDFRRDAEDIHNGWLDVLWQERVQYYDNLAKMTSHLSSGANRPPDNAVTVNINAEFNLIPVDPIIECFSRDLVPEYCHALEASAVSTALPFLIESLHGRSNWSLPCLPLYMHAEDIIPTFLTWNIYIGLCHPKALTLSRLRSYEMFEVLVIVRFNSRMVLR
jgi:hypothetical protein